MLAKKREVIPDLRANLKEASDRFEEASKAREQRRKVDDLKKELAWAHVAAKGRERDAKLKELEDAKSLIPKAELAKNKAQQRIDTTTRQISEFEDEFTSLGEPEALKTDSERVRETLHRKAEKLRDVQRDIRDLNSTVGTVENQIKEFEGLIEAENRKIAAQEGGRLEELQAQLQAARVALNETESDAKELGKQVQAQREVIAAIGREGGQADHVKLELQGRLTETEGALARAQAAVNNELAVYGNGMRGALEKIARSRWQGEVPIGPFGRYVKLRDHKWAHVVRGQLGKLMFAFTITDGRDRTQLKAILDEYKWWVDPFFPISSGCDC
jgi:structural maintenance of chromosomes protein 6